MAVRSIHLKFVLSRKEASRRLRQSLWLTHATVNQAVAEIERILLLCRGRGYADGEGQLVTAEQVQADAIAFARQVQANNGRRGVGSDADLLESLSTFYEALVPSVMLDDRGEPIDGDAQAAGGFASPLMDARSQGFQSVFDKVLDPPPAWIEHMAGDLSGWHEESIQWLETPDARALLSASGSPPSWVRRLKSGDGWQEAFVADQAKKRKETTGLPALIRRLKDDLGLLPLFAPPITSGFATPQSGLTPWDRLALRLAVGHLLSWESWNHRAAQEHRRILQRVEAQREELAAFGELVDRLRDYERQRHEQLKRVALANDDNPYRIGMRAMRGWDRVRDEWRKPQSKDAPARLEVVATLQSKLGGKFGDPELFRWLAQSGRESLWHREDPLPVLARLNALERLLQRKKDRAAYTRPDARHHPRWVNYEAPGGSNLRNYRPDVRDGKLVVSLPLLSDSSGKLVEETFDLTVAPSGQLGDPKWTENHGGERRLTFRSAYQEFTAKLGGSEFFFSRHRLENRSTERLAEGDFGPAWFKLVLDTEYQGPPEWLDARGRVATPPEIHHFNTALVTKSKHEAALSAGLRVLSVDLGMRSFAACSVFELVEGQPDNFAFLADARRDLWAKHERSFVLSLPGENPDARVLAARSAALDELGALRRHVNRLRSTLRLAAIESPEERAAAVAELIASYHEEHSDDIEQLVKPTLLEMVAQRTVAAQPIWEEMVQSAYADSDSQLTQAIETWRRKTRPRATDGADRRLRRAYSGGKSAWAVVYLESVRRILQTFSLRGRVYGQINRADRQRRGVFAARLLAHINGLKRDRIKAGSDSIIQASRGYLPGRVRGWVQRFEPCRLILFEDLARYRFRTDRPRRENAQLMRWSHREVLSEATMQAGLYGPVIGTTGAGFTSRFHARSGAPGCRVRVLSAMDCKSPHVIRQLEFLGERLGLDPSTFRAGMRVPWEGGGEFATLAADGRSVVIHADINAAQNLQRRFWTRHADAYRLSAMQVAHGSETAWYPDRDGVRLRGGLSLLVGGDGYARLVPASDGDGFHLTKVAKSQWRQATGLQGVTDEDGDASEVDAMLDDWTENEPAIERGREKRVFFRDPSGNVLRSDRWYEAKEFWGRVTRRVARALGLRAPMEAQA